MGANTTNLRPINVSPDIAKRVARARADLGVTMNVIAGILLERGLAEIDREAAAGGGPLTDAILARKTARRRKGNQDAK
jgi:hypothetical protein